jgi:hypothetical protein
MVEGGSDSPGRRVPGSLRWCCPITRTAVTCSNAEAEPIHNCPYFRVGGDSPGITAMWIKWHHRTNSVAIYAFEGVPSKSDYRRD